MSWHYSACHQGVGCVRAGTDSLRVGDVAVTDRHPLDRHPLNHRPVDHHPLDHRPLDREHPELARVPRLRAAVRARDHQLLRRLVHLRVTGRWL